MMAKAEGVALILANVYVERQNVTTGDEDRNEWLYSPYK